MRQVRHAPQNANDMTTWSPDREVGHAVADLLDDAGALVPEHARQGEGDEPFPGAEVGVAEAGRDDADQHLVALRALDLDLLEHERLVVGGQHRRGGRRHVGSPLGARRRCRRGVRGVASWEWIQASSE